MEIAKIKEQTKHYANRTIDVVAQTVATLLLLVTVAAALWVVLRPADTPKRLQLASTPINIEEVRPTGELYVLSGYTEDYVIKDTIDKPLGRMNTGLSFLDNAVNTATSPLDRHHKCIQMEKAKVSFVLNLDEVEYSVDSVNRVVAITLPKVRFKLSTQGAPFLSDDKDFWRDYDTNRLKREVKQRIAERFDTPDNRSKAMLYATNAIGSFVELCGMEPQFTNKYLEVAPLD